MRSVDATCEHTVQCDCWEIKHVVQGRLQLTSQNGGTRVLYGG
jgi:uncharacterized cupin superfamily protein